MRLGLKALQLKRNTDVSAMSLRRSSRHSTASAVTAGDTPPAHGKRVILDGESQQGRTKKSKKTEMKIPNGDPIDGTFKVPPVPETPKKKRITKTTKPPPFTPTPSLVDLMRTNYSSGDIDDATPPPRDRLVEPHVTNATLVTPGGTQSVAYSNGLPDSSSSRTGLPPPTATTGNVLEQACAHLISVDPKMKPLIDKHPCSIFSPAGLAEAIDPFRSLCTGIIGQQVSGAAAKSIKNKFIGLFNESNPEAAVFPRPAEVAATDLARLRLAGLSGRKAEYIQGLAQKFASGELTTSMLMRATDEELFQKLIAVRGLGRWSVEMFACFALKRLDILSTGDLGVQRGMAAFVGKDVSKLKAKGGGKWKYMSEKDMLEISEKFAPYRSLFMWYMWRVENVDVSAIQDNAVSWTEDGGGLVR